MALLLTMASPSAYADFAAGLEAYDGGDYARAAEEWRRAAEANGTGKTKAKGRAKTSARAKARKPVAQDTQAETNA